jgi:hypothetical protein
MVNLWHSEFFFNSRKRPQSFTSQEQEIIELMAQDLGRLITIIKSNSNASK